MHAAVVHSFDKPPRYEVFADPVAGEGELIVKVHAAALHRVVKSRASGAHYSSGRELPIIPGVDGAGELPDGTRVYFGAMQPRFGSFAELSVTADWICMPLPDGLDYVTAAAIMNPAVSSWAPLKIRALLAAKESVLILGATGVAGHLAVQIAKRLGSRRVIAVGRDPEALKKLSEVGADSIISLQQDRDATVTALKQELAENGVDVVLDYVWGSPAEILLEAITKLPMKRTVTPIRWVQIGAMAGDTISLSSSTLRSTGVEITGSGLGSVSLQQIVQSAHEFLGEMGKNPFKIETRSAPLRDVETLWNSPQGHARLVFVP